MALNFYCGSPGAGKSYHVVKEVVIQALLNGKNIITNLPLKMGEIYKAFPQLVEQNNYVQVIASERIKEIHKIVDTDKYANWVIVIDEAHDYWPSGETMKDKDFMSWLSQHRHKFQNIVMITQDFWNINKFVRSMVQERFEFEKNESRGSQKTYMQDFFLKQSKKKVDRKICKYEPAYFKFYHSHDVGVAEAGFKEERVGKKMNLLRKPMLFGLVGVFAILYGVVGLFAGISADPSGNEKGVEIKAVKKSAVFSPDVGAVGVSARNRPFKQKEVVGVGGNSFGWCRGVMRVWAGVGVKKGSGWVSRTDRVKIRGAFIVVGLIGVGNNNIYILRDKDRKVSKLRAAEKTYELGEKICL